MSDMSGYMFVHTHARAHTHVYMHIQMQISDFRCALPLDGRYVKLVGAFGVLGQKDEIQLGMK